jgi:hypothetical protein
MKNRKDTDVGLTASSGGLAGNSPCSRGRLARLITLTLLSGALLGAGAPASAALLIDFGNQTLLPDTPGQSITVTISNDGEPVPLGGFELFLQVADGGPEWPAGSISGPAMESVDLLNGTPFQNNNFGGQFESLDNVPQRQFWSVVGTPTLPTGSGQLLATVTFDTTGLGSGTWDLFLAELPGAGTRLLNPLSDPYDVAIVNGTLTVVPEPSAGATVAGCLLLGALVSRHVRRQSRRKKSESTPGATR